MVEFFPLKKFSRRIEMWVYLNSFVVRTIKRVEEAVKAQDLSTSAMSVFIK